MLKKIYEFIDESVRNNDVLHGICFIICGIIGFMWLFLSVFDTTPATKADYEPLIKQNSIIQENFNTVYTYDNYEISPSEDNIKVTFSNKQCKIACTYDKNFKFINYKEIDLASSKLSAIFPSLFLGFVLIGGVGTWFISMFIPFILSWLLKFLEWICLLLVGRR